VPLYTIYGTRCVSYLSQSTHWGHWCKRTYNVGTRLDYCNAERRFLNWLQPFYHSVSCSCWRCDKTAAISSENSRSFSIRNNLPGPLSLIYAAPVASGVVQNRFQEHNPVSTYMNSAYDRLKFFEVVLGCRIINAKSTDIRQRSSALDP